MAVKGSGSQSLSTYHSWDRGTSKHRGNQTTVTKSLPSPLLICSLLHIFKILGAIKVTFLNKYWKK